MKQLIKQRLARLEEELAKMVCIDVQIEEKESGKILKDIRGRGSRHRVLRIRASF